MNPETKDIQDQIDELCKLITGKAFEGRMAQVRSRLLALQEDFIGMSHSRMNFIRRIKLWIFK